MSAATHDQPSGEPLIWITAGAVAVMLHIVVFAQGLIAFETAVNMPPAPQPKETKIIATSLGIASAPAVVAEEPRAAAPATLAPERMSAETPRSERVEMVAAAPERLAAVTDSVAPAPAEVTSSTPEPVASVERAVPAVQTAPALAPVEEVTTPSVAGIAAPEPPRAIQAAPTANADTVNALTQVTPARERIAETVGPVVAANEPDPPRDVVTPVEEPVEAEPERLAVLTPEIEEVSPVQPPETGEEISGIASVNPPVQTAEEAQATYTDVLDVLRSYPVVDCFAALPSLSEGNAFQLETFAGSSAELDAFRSTLQAKTEALPGTVMKPVSQAQCDALPFVTKSAQYPEFQLYFDLSARDIESGAQLQGRIGNLTGGFLSLLLIDDDGIVQDLTSFLSFRPGAAEFSIPMTLQGSPVETRQLLMALSTTTRLQTLKGLSGQPARDVFSQLALEILLQGGGEDIALVGFSVQ